MSEEKPSVAKWIWWQFMTTWPLFVAAALTVIFGVWVSNLASEVVENAAGVSMTRWEQFRAGEPNTMGDTLAGFIGSLTLIWVVASVIQQSMELRAQRREFAEMVRAQDAQVKALNAQAIIFEDEKFRRDQEVNRQYIHRIIRSFVATVKYSEHLSIAWRPIKAEAQNQLAFLDRWSLFPLGAPPDDIEDAFLLYARQAQTSSHLLKAITDDVQVQISDTQSSLEGRRIEFLIELKELISLCDLAISSRNSLSTVEHQLLAHLNVDVLLCALNRVSEIFEERFV